MESKTTTTTLCSPSLPPLPEKRIVVGFGGIGIDYLATVAAFPKPGDKIRSTSVKVQGGGNVGNALTAAARLGLTSRMITKVANDAYGRSIVAELEADNVDTSYIVVSEGYSSLNYIIVDEQAKTRTCIHTPGSFSIAPDDLSPSSLSSSLNGARLVYSDGRLHETALVILKEATRMNIPILIDAERKREGLDGLLNLADYVVCAAKFPQSIMKLTAHGLGAAVSGRLFVGSAEMIPPTELVDTTGAGDAFIGAILYAICAGMPPEKMLPFAAKVAAASCRALGARTGLPCRGDPCLAPFLM